ncbi:MAG: protease B [Cyanothece sp. SIO1E1]|nr:protease B [Cyanothece sp. SIO1E1]
MKKLNYLLIVVSLSLFAVSCAKDKSSLEGEVPQEILDKIAQLGFNPDGAELVDEGYRVERDIILTHENLEGTDVTHRVPHVEQYSTNNLVSTNGSRNIVIYAPVGGNKGYSPAMIAGLDLAIARYNAENLEITFSRTTNRRSNDIKMTRLSRRDEQRGVLGSAGFPTAGGDPYNEIKMSGILESAYGLSVEGIATIIAHEIGHCVGFRHTDYFDRSISCGGSPTNEGTAGVGANHIPGTPTGASLAQKSFMLSCTDGSDRPFNNDDKTALDYLY